MVEILELELFTFCSHRCLHCYISPQALSDTQSVFSDKRFCTDIVNWAVDNGVLRIILTGGEPTLAPHFTHILTECEQHGIPITIYTNGVKGKSFWETHAHLACVIDLCEVTLYGFSSNTYQEFARNSGGFQNAKMFIDSALDLGVNVLIKYPDLPALESDWDMAREWAEALGVKILKAGVTVTAGSYTPQFNLPILQSSNIDIPDRTRESYSNYCGAGFSSIRITANGEVRSCQIVSSGIRLNSVSLLDQAIRSMREGIRPLAQLGRSPCAVVTNPNEVLSVKKG
ncbi:MAG TPA: radical SAM protein [Pyrinomonadaceae bacterium]